MPADSELLFYEGLHGAVVTDGIDIASHVDLLIGVVPVINLEWIQKLHRDRAARALHHRVGDRDATARMPDDLNFIVSQFTKTHINFQRVPVLDTSNPFSARFIPTLDESFLVVRFRDLRGIDFAWLLQMLAGRSCHARIPLSARGKVDLARQLIFTPMIWPSWNGEPGPATLALMIPLRPGTVVLPSRSPGRYVMFVSPCGRASEPRAPEGGALRRPCYV